MLDFLFTVGQAVSAVLLLYGGFVVIREMLPSRRKALDPALEDELLLLRHLHKDA